MAADQKPGPWVEIWEQCEHCGGTGIEPQTHVGLRESCHAGCTWKVAEAHHGEGVSRPAPRIEGALNSGTLSDSGSMDCLR